MIIQIITKYFLIEQALKVFMAKLQQLTKPLKLEEWKFLSFDHPYLIYHKGEFEGRMYYEGCKFKEWKNGTKDRIIYFRDYKSTNSRQDSTFYIILEREYEDYRIITA